MQLETYINNGNRIVGRYIWSLEERTYGRVVESTGDFLILHTGDKIPRSSYNKCRVTQPLTD